MFRRRILVTTILLLIVIGAFAFAMYWRSIQAVNIPTGTPSGELAFVSNRTGDWDIFVVDPAGEVRNLTGDDSGGDDYFASWDFASERVNFLTDRSGDMGPGQVAPDGTGLRTLSVGQAVMTLFGERRLNWDGQWSPDGEKIVWASLRDLNLEIYVADAAGGNEQRLTNDGGRDWFPAWSPDGTKVVFSSDRGGNENIYIIDADGNNLRQLTTDEASETRPLWSLDGTKILFVSQVEHDLVTGVIDYYVITSGAEPFDTITKLGAGEVFEGDPVWSPDGSQAAFMSNREGDWNIYLMDADGENIRRVTEGESDDVFPVWRPAAAE